MVDSSLPPCYLCGMEAVKTKIPGEAHRLAKIEAAKQGITLQDFLVKIIVAATNEHNGDNSKVEPK